MSSAPLTPAAAQATGLPAGLPVLVGAGDYPMALLGSGAIAAGTGSDVTGTSTILTLIQPEPVIAGGISNVLSAAGDWGSFTLLDAGGDAVRWARRAFHDNALTYAEVDEAASRSVPGANRLFFLPYLSGERFGQHRNSRAQFFGLTAGHQLSDMHRAVLEGVAFSVRLELDRLQQGHTRPDRIIAASGGAKSALWLSIKASMYRTPYLVAEEPECGIIGAGILMAVATGAADSVARCNGADGASRPRNLAGSHRRRPLRQDDADLFRAFTKAPKPIGTIWTHYEHQGNSLGPRWDVGR